MPFNRPTLATLTGRIAADVESRIAGAFTRLRHSVLGVLTRMLAGAFHELYGYVDWIARAIFPDTAQSTELRRWAAIWGVVPHAATRATGTLTVTGTAGATVPDRTVWRSADTSAEYASTAAAVLASGTATVAVAATVAGVAANAPTGQPVSMLSPVAGVASDAVVATAIAGGADAEGDDALRERLLARIRRPPSLGTTGDYEQWARAAHPDVTRVWTQALASGLGTATVRFMTDDATANGIPEAAVVSVVDTYIQARRPVTAQITVEAPAAVALNVTIDDLVTDTPAVRAAVEAEIADLVRRESKPGGTILLSHIREAISSALGEIDHTLVSPTADVAHTTSQIAVPGTVTWQ